MEKRLCSPTPLILHVVYSFSVGGLENGVANLINRLPASNWRHGVISLTDVSREFRNRIERTDTLFMGLGKRPGHGFWLYPRLFRLFRELQPAIVHTRNLAALEAVVPAAAARVRARVHGEHGRDVNDLDGSNRKYQRVRRLYSPFVTRYVALSRDLEIYLRERVGIATRRIEQIYNGVDTDRFRPPIHGRAPITGCPFQSEQLWLIGSIGRIEAVKDQATLARAFVRALRIHSEARQRLRLILVGEGSLRARVEEYLRNEGALELTWFAGERSDVPQLMRGLDCFVLSSLAEGISNTILEAMASGLPVVATRVGGNPELTEEGITGRLVPPADEVALAEQLTAYFANPATARRHGQAGRQVVERNFSLENMVERYDRFYTETLKGGRAERASRRSPSPEPANN
jgi:sugar transferase (PEP-CTERM/EpsH1 system associated)